MAARFSSKLISDKEIFLREIQKAFFDNDDEAVFVDVESPDRVVINGVKKLIYAQKSPYQEVQVFSTRNFGLVLALDGLTQVSQADEALYHEFLIHPACLLFPEASSAIILGGGDGCAARELLKYDRLRTIEMVEIDQMVIDACREHFRPVNAGGLDNPRLRIVVQDAVAYLRDQTDRRYDLILADLTEPYDLDSLSGSPGDLSKDFFSPSFYEFLKSRMSDKAILAVQTGGITNIPDLDRHHHAIIEGLCESFKVVSTAYIHVHSFLQLWSITLASDYPYDIEGFDPEPVMRKLGIRDLKYYNTVAHRKAFRDARS